MGAIFGFAGARDDSLLGGMSALQRHRGDAGEQRSASLHHSIAYRAKHESSLRRAAGLCERGDRTIALAGAVYEIEGGDVALESLLDRYEAEGPDFVEGLSGAFVLAIADGDSLHLFRDGAGLRTLYYGLHEGRLFFAVEPKAILAAPGFPRRIDPAGVARYLTFSFQPLEATMLEGLRELPAGSRLQFRRGEAALPEPRRWFDFTPEAAEGGTAVSDEAWVQRFRDTHARAVADRLRPGEPVGVFLSGGIDSSAVTAELRRQVDAPIRSWAIHFGEEYPHELDHARAVAERCGTDHEEVLIRPKDFLPNLRRAIWFLDDPIGDPVTIPNFELAARASRELRFVFNGEGGDPCFGGPKNLPMLLHHWYGVPREPRFRERRYLESFRRAYEEIDRLLAPDLRRQIDRERDLEAPLTPYLGEAVAGSFLDKLQATNVRWKGAHLILPKVERMTSAWGLTSLSPLFDDRMVKLAFAMPPRLRLAAGVEKVALKRAYADGLPPEIAARPKSGMRVPVHWWFRGEMKRYARKLLSPKAIRAAGIFDEHRVRQLLDYDTEEGPGRYGLRLWMLVTFEIWRRLVIENEAL